MAELNTAQALNQALDEILAADARAVVLGEDVGRTGGVFRITDGLAERHGERRVIDTPVAARVPRPEKAVATPRTCSSMPSRACPSTDHCLLSHPKQTIIKHCY